MIKPALYSSEEITALFSQATRDDSRELHELQEAHPEFKPAAASLDPLDEGDDI